MGACCSVVRQDTSLKTSLPFQTKNVYVQNHHASWNYDFC